LKKDWLFFAVIGIIVVCCLSIYVYTSEKEVTDRCSPLPEEFSEVELVGTWVAGWPGHTDTLIFRADRKYKQVIHVEFVDKPSIDYQSGWQSWHLENSEDNITYLHLDGMRFCGMNPGISCEKRVGGGYDFCRDESIQMLNEGILLVLAASDDQSSGTEVPQYYIYLHYPLGSENSWVYALQEP
jgi:hypothetical protein